MFEMSNSSDTCSMLLVAEQREGYCVVAGNTIMLVAACAHWGLGSDSSIAFLSGVP